MTDLLRRIFRAPISRIALVAVLLAGAAARPALALPQDSGEEPSPAEEVMQIPDDEAVARGSDSPRNAVFTFIVLARDGEWMDAADMLELPGAGWPEGVPATRIARALKGILDHRLWVDFPSLPGASANAPDAPKRVTIGVVDTPETVLEVEMVRVDDRWIFAASTVQGVPDMARAIDLWWVSALPEFLVNVRVAEIELWQWIGIVAIAGAGLLIGWGLTWLLRHGMLRILGPAVEPLIMVLTPLVFLLSVLGMRVAQPFLVLSAPARENLSLGSRAALVFVIAWLVVRWVRVVAVAVEAQMAHFTGFGESSLNIEVRATFRTLDMPAYRAAVQSLNVDFMRIVARHGSGFAFPSRTVYMAQDTGVGQGSGGPPPGTAPAGRIPSHGDAAR